MAAGLRQAAADHVADAQQGHIQPSATGTEALAVIAVVCDPAAISTPSTLRTKTMSSVVLNADLVSAVLTPDLASVVRRGASTSARYMGVFVVEPVVVIIRCDDL